MTTSLVSVMNRIGPPGFPIEAGYGVYRGSDGGWPAPSVAHEDRFWRPPCAVAGLADEIGALAGLAAAARRGRA
jgi:hypothetical protein